MILQENSQTIKPEVILLSSKLKNMNLHLRELLAKKIRLELEIRHLKKSISEKQKHVLTTVKAKAVMESVEFPLSKDQIDLLFQEDREMYHLLKEYDDQEFIYKQILQEFQEEE